MDPRAHHQLLTGSFTSAPAERHDTYEANRRSFNRTPPENNTSHPTYRYAPDDKQFQSCVLWPIVSSPQPMTPIGFV